MIVHAATPGAAPRQTEILLTLRHDNGQYLINLQEGHGPMVRDGRVFKNLPQGEASMNLPKDGGLRYTVTEMDERQGTSGFIAATTIKVLKTPQEEFILVGAEVDGRWLAIDDAFKPKQKAANATPELNINKLRSDLLLRLPPSPVSDKKRDRCSKIGGQENGRLALQKVKDLGLPPEVLQAFESLVCKLSPHSPLKIVSHSIAEKVESLPGSERLSTAAAFLLLADQKLCSLIAPGYKRNLETLPTWVLAQIALTDSWKTKWLGANKCEKLALPFLNHLKTLLMI